MNTSLPDSLRPRLCHRQIYCALLNQENYKIVQLHGVRKSTSLHGKEFSIMCKRLPTEKKSDCCNFFLTTNQP